ncbi:unnamed protein product [Miscanthus lutarioriparius]|uniref:Uncharacterized protein n=1 Tax=Miscanthus lutarioriparius TaxID=422564 RepID=A0A811Q9S4_9POAL|nr:unnamed protein product [Miscanthus lutarioriparius]
MNWTAEEAPADDAQEVWAPAVGHPLQYASIADIFGSSCSLQPYVVPASSYSSGGQQQLVEYNYYNYYAAAAQHHDPDPMETYMNSPEKLFQERQKEFKDDAKLMKTKMHRYPPSIQALGDWCTVPKVVAIGPYYHRRDHLQKAEKMKHVAAQYCIQLYNNDNSGLSVRYIYDAVVSVAWEIDARGLYDKDVMAGIGYEDDFLPMMFYDACFLVIYMLRKSGKPFDPDLYNFFESNDNDIAHDIMLLENQIPLQVVDAVMDMCTSEPLQEMKSFIAMWRRDGFLQDLAKRDQLPGVDWDQDYCNKAPHLLGLLRFYAVGKRSRKTKVTRSDLEKMDSISFAGAIEFAEMGIFVTAKETTELPDMGLDRKWIIFAELTMAPLCLNDARASLLVNMAALELCTTPDFFDDTAEFEDSAVCSYLLLCMLMHREEDVHELRTKGIMRGGAGLNNKKTFDFFTSLQSLRIGRCYALVMVEIQNYKNKRPWIKVYAFLYNNWKYIVAVGSAFGGFIGIITALMRLKGAH